MLFRNAPCCGPRHNLNTRRYNWDTDINTDFPNILLTYTRKPLIEVAPTILAVFLLRHAVNYYRQTRRHP